MIRAHKGQKKLVHLCAQVIESRLHQQILNNEEGGAKIDHSGDANDQTQDDWDAWLDAALNNLGNFIVSETTRN
jgi:hypothetical protein